MTEQQGGFPILVALAVLAGAQAWGVGTELRLACVQPPPSCEMRGEYQGRNDEGRPTYRYFRRCAP